MKNVESVHKKLIVSCQALPHEPLHSSYIMGRMAAAAKEGGAAGIRANTKEDIAEIKKNVDLPVIGIVKRDYPDSQVFITPTMKEIEELVEAETDIIALDATCRTRPDGKLLDEFYWEIRETYPEQLLMADFGGGTARGRTGVRFYRYDAGGIYPGKPGTEDRKQ